MNNKFLIFLMVIFSSSLLAQNNKDISGLYGECEIGFLSCEQMYLSPNGTFSYFLCYDVGGGYVSEGHWQYKFDTLYLNTYKQPKQQKSYIVNSVSNNPDSILIHVYDYDSTNMSFAQIVINNTIHLTCGVS